jgi:hypothetical protein
MKIKAALLFIQTACWNQAINDTTLRYSNTICSLPELNNTGLFVKIV